jgi:hypothetical protein
LTIKRLVSASKLFLSTAPKSGIRQRINDSGHQDVVEKLFCAVILSEAKDLLVV